MPWLVWSLSVSVERGLKHPCDWMNGRQCFPFCLLNRIQDSFRDWVMSNTCVVATIDRPDMRLVDPSQSWREPMECISQPQAMFSIGLPNTNIWERRPTMFSDLSLLPLLYLLRWYSYYLFQTINSILIFFVHWIASPSVHSVRRKQIHCHNDLVFHYSKTQFRNIRRAPTSRARAQALSSRNYLHSELSSAHRPTAFSFWSTLSEVGPS